MQRILSAIGTACATLVLGAAGATMIGAVSPAAAAGRPAHQTALIPFEADRAKERGDRFQLKLNDDATLIPGHRIRSLPIVDGKLGEWAKLDGLDVYFPFGRIVRTQTEYHKFKPGMGEPDPNYKQIAAFDKALGPVCATETSGNVPAEMRINQDHVISLVQVLPIATADDGKSYRVVNTLEMRFLQDEPMADRLYRSCQSNSKPGPTIVTR